MTDPYNLALARYDRERRIAAIPPARNLDDLVRIAVEIDAFDPEHHDPGDEDVRR